MSDPSTENEIDLAVRALRSARSRPVVAKLELAKLRSTLPDAPVLAFEGDDDKIVYNQWIGRIRPEFRYVNFPCGGKGHILSLRKLLQNDQTGLRNGVHFFIDRDYDDLRGHEDGPDIFMTDKYSVENYFLDPEVLDSALEIEFHCHAAPELRAQLLETFERLYEEFLNVTHNANSRLYVARKLNLEIKPLPTAIGKIASVSLTEVQAGSLSDEEIVCYIEEPDPTLVGPLQAEFLELDRRARFRGKFALLFLTKWLRELADQNALDDRGLFAPLTNKSAFRVAELTLTRFASRSPLPNGLQAFAQAI